MSLNWHDLIGTTGVAIIVWAYFLLQTGRVAAVSARYSWMNLIGATLILISLFFTFNFASFVIEVFWIGASCIGLWKYWRRSRQCEIAQ